MDKDAPPFATSQGMPKNPTGGATGAHDFVTDPKSHSPATGARDWTKENRPQKSGCAEPNPQEVPAGGKVLKADPTGPAANPPSGGVMGVSQKPFKLKGEGAAAATPTVVDSSDAGTDSSDVGSAPDDHDSY